MKLKENFDHARTGLKPAVLFARADSIYKQLDCDVWDQERDALRWPGGVPAVAHPPCRAWGRLRKLAKPLLGEKELAIFAIDQIRKFGGVLEHPEGSKLWEVCSLPLNEKRDEFGGWTLSIDQDWFGHRAEKSTWLYIVGCDPVNIPSFPLVLEDPKYVVTNLPKLRKGMPRWRPEIRKAEREATPPLFADWLLELARRCAK